MSGMVMAPVVTVLAMEDPDMEPMAADATTAALAGPPLNLPMVAKDKFIKYSPAPVFSNSEPKSTNKNTKVAETRSGIDQSPSPDM